MKTKSMGADSERESMSRVSNLQTTMVERLSGESDSAVRKYQEVHVGSTSITALLKYELVTSLFSGIPGAAGYFLRRATYGLLIGRTGHGLAVGQHVTFRCPDRMSLGDNVFLDGQAVLDAKGDGSSIALGNSVLIGRGTILSCGEGRITLGNTVTIGPGSYLRAGLGPVEVGSQVTIGAHSILISGSPGYRNLDVPMHKQVGSGEGVRVGDDVWIGVGVKVVDGVSIGTGSVVGAGAVVLEDVPDNAIVAGVPAKKIGERS